MENLRKRSFFFGVLTGRNPYRSYELRFSRWLPFAAELRHPANFRQSEATGLIASDIDRKLADAGWPHGQSTGPVARGDFVPFGQEIQNGSSAYQGVIVAVTTPAAGDASANQLWAH